MNTFDLYEEDEMLLAHEDFVDDQIDLPEAQEEIPAPPQDEPSRWFRLYQALLAILWQRRPRWQIEDMYRRDEREFAQPQPFKPTSLSRRIIADIWMLNSKH